MERSLFDRSIASFAGCGRFMRISVSANACHIARYRLPRRCI